MDLLLVEDDQSLGYILKEYLELHGFAVSQAKDGEEGWSLFGRKSYQLCIPDIMLPQKDGFTLAKEIRSQDAEVPIIFLTSRALKVDKLKGFRIGPDDYLVKPVDEEELIARIRAILKRSQQSAVTKASEQVSQYQIGQFLFDVKNQRLHFQNKVQPLTRKEVEILRRLLGRLQLSKNPIQHLRQMHHIPLRHHHRGPNLNHIMQRPINTCKNMLLT